MAWTRNYSDNRKIERVLPLLLEMEKEKEKEKMNDYLPKVVSLGPYHHGKPELAFVEAFKPTAVDMFITGSRESKDFYHSKVLEIVEDIQSCYEQEWIAKYSKDELARMMLRDASLVILHMEHIAWAKTMKLDEAVADKVGYMMEHLGSLIMQNLLSDLRLLENQIPLFLVKFLIRLRYGAGKDDELVSSFFGEFRQESLRQEFEEEEPLHLLEATHRLLFSDSGKPEKSSRGGGWLSCTRSPKETDLEIGGVVPTISTTSNHRNSILASVGKLLARKSAGAAAKPKDDIKDYVPTFRSATDLKAKGIYFKAGSSKSLKNVNFKPHLFYARLQLPQLVIYTNTKVWWKNMIAYEVGPGTRANGLHLLSYISFMKSLIQSLEDVKELREKKVLCNMLDSDEEVLGAFRDVNAHWIGAILFKEVHDQIQAHCNSRTKTWMAELVHANFRSPWTVIAFVAAVALLAVSAAQLYYAVNPN